MAVLLLNILPKTNDWTDLVLSNQDWLDKPHFPFGSLHYPLRFWYKFICLYTSGFLFHLLGAIYTYRLSNLLYIK